MTELERGGVLAVIKPGGMTSHDVVNAVRKIFGTKKVGHTGTLDPMASGVLVILVGRAVKATEYISSSYKKYRATLRLGMTTDTEDVTGAILSESKDIPSAEAVDAVCREFVGEIMQVPPMYSALKVNGQKLVDLARRGIEIEREARPVTVHSLTCKYIEESDYELKVSCSAGTYIRTLCADIGKALGCGGVMAALRRTETGHFALADCVTPDQLEQMTDEERVARLVPTESLFVELPAVKLPAFYEKLCRNGCEIYQKKIGVDHKIGTRVRLLDANGQFFALGEAREYEGGTAIKGIKYFDV